MRGAPGAAVSSPALQHCSAAALQHRATSFITSGIRFLREDKLSRAAAQQQHTSGGLIPGTPAPDTAKLIGCLLLVADVAVERMCFIGSSTAKGCCCSL